METFLVKERSSFEEKKTIRIVTIKKKSTLSIHLCQDDDPVILLYLYRILPMNWNANQLLPSWSHSHYRILFQVYMSFLISYW